ncbi:hypothetical protein GF376_00600 [Candidatus Peregrinibacteria bacterium]|nr:hypothetical protein [Candidatus Peregrinibacteria bacterium]
MLKKEYLKIVKSLKAYRLLPKATQKELVEIDESICGAVLNYLYSTDEALMLAKEKTIVNIKSTEKEFIGFCNKFEIRIKEKQSTQESAKNEEELLGQLKTLR